MATNDRSARASRSEDRGAVVAMLAAAFQDDPIMAYIFPDPGDRRVRLPKFFAVVFDSDGAHGARYMTAGGEAATIWRDPGNARTSVFEKVSQGLPWILAAGLSLGRAIVFSDKSDANHPPEPHWYLHVAGCAPSSQGQGFGSAVIAAGLARADTDAVASYLETATETNLGFYQRFGFAVTHDWRLPNGTLVWSMSRPARKATG